MKKIAALLGKKPYVKLFIAGVVITLLSWPISNYNWFVMLRLIAFVVFFVALYFFINRKRFN